MKGTADVFVRGLKKYLWQINVEQIREEFKFVLLLMIY